MTTEEQMFEYAFHKVLEHEGGYVDHPDDPGGETKWGVSKRDHPDLDIRSLTREEAKAIYRREYWEPGGFGQLRDLKVAAKLFDMAVNMGTKLAVSFLQRAINYLVKWDTEITVDGVLGLQTAALANSLGPELLVLALRAYQAKWYVELVEGPDKRFETFSRGWLLRAMG